jgi:hypothetical protein
MLRSLTTSPLVSPAAVLLLATLAALAPTTHAAVWPEQWSNFKRGTAKPAPVPDAALAEEYGIEGGEQADFDDGKQKFTGTAWRLKDSTSALAWWLFLRPATATPSDLVDQAVAIPGGVLFQYGNYVLKYDGFVPTKEQLETFVNILPKLQDSAVPALYKRYPAKDLVPNSERYILGPVSLERFAPKIPLAAAAFSMGAEAQSGRIRTPGGPVDLVLFAYPTPLMARARAAEFQQGPQVAVKRAGPLVAVVLGSPSADATERVLARVGYKATVSWDQDPGKQDFNVARVVLGNLYLAAVLITVSVGTGALFALARILSRKYGSERAEGSYIVLGLEKK